MPSPPAIKAPQIYLWHPQIQDTPITNKVHLHQILEQEYLGLKRNREYFQLLRDAEHHLALIQRLKDRTHLHRGERTTLAKQLGISRQKFTAWAQDARPPRLYYLLERSISKTQAHTKLTQIHHENNSIKSTEDVKQRLKTYYPGEELEKSKLHQKRLTQCNIYFKALSLLKEGGCYLDIARELDTHHSQIMRWFDGRRPDYIEITRRIPAEYPKLDYKWLPRRMEGNFHPSLFIQVPINIQNWRQIQEVLGQISPLQNEHMQQWQQRFETLSQDAAFAYILGVMVSDAAKPQTGFTSTKMDLRLSKKYSWSEQFGEATSFYLGQVGIFSEKGPDRDSSAGPRTCYSWASENSPLLTWISQSCLGLKPHERTTYHPIKANWLLTSPREFRLKFLQGLNDGDGSASIKDQTLSNTCGPNIPFVRQLLQTFKIGSSKDSQRIKITRQECIMLAAKLPFFLHATERQRNADKLAEMMRIRREENPRFIPKEVIAEVHRLKRQGLSNGTIAEQVFDKFRVSYDKRRIDYILRKYPQGL